MSLRKYENPDQRNVRQEKEIFEFISDICKYEHNAVYYLGASLLWSSYGKTGLLPSDIVERYSRFFQSEDQTILPQSAIENFRDLITRRLEEIKEEKTKHFDEPLIHVYNKITRSEEDIPEHLYHPKMHERL